jgi:hypothetical protein
MATPTVPRPATAAINPTRFAGGALLAPLAAESVVGGVVAE